MLSQLGWRSSAAPRPHAPRQGRRTVQHVFTQPHGRAARPCGHHGPRHLLVIVVEDLEAVVAAKTQVAQAVQPHHEFGQRLAVHALAGEQQLDLGLSGVAVPVKDRKGECVGAMGMTVNLQTHPAAKLVETYLPPLREAARALRPIL